jgi:hypothetical protein
MRYSFLISLFNFIKRYPKFKDITISINFKSKNFSIWYFKFGIFSIFST